MRNLLLVALTFVTFGFTSCVNVKEEIWIEPHNKLTVDYSLQIPTSDNMQFAGMLLQSFLRNYSENFLGNQSSLDLNLDLSSNFAPSDTSIFIKDMENWKVDSIRKRVDEMDERNVFTVKEKNTFSKNMYAIGNASLLRFGRSAKGDFEIAFKIHSMDYTTLYNAGTMIKRIRKEYPDEKANVDDATFLQSNFWFKLNKSSFERGKLLAMANGNNNPLNSVNIQSDTNVTEQFSFTSIIHLPKRIKNSENNDAQIKGKTIALKYSLKELSEGKSIENKIRF